MSYALAPQHSPIVVRKYGNRRLYRTDESRYVTLDELAGMIRDGDEFVVEDAKSGDDLTGVVLAQLILEEERAAAGGAFPVELLRQLIRLRHDDFADFLNHHLPRLAEMYLEGRRALTDSLDRTVSPEQGKTEALASQLGVLRAQLDEVLAALGR